MNYNIDDIIPAAFTIQSTAAPDSNLPVTAPNYNSSFTAPNYNPSSTTSNYNASPLRYPSVGLFQSALSHIVAPGQLGSESSFKIPPALSTTNMDGTLDDNQIKELISQGCTLGMAKPLAENNLTFPIWFWIVDNSRSMIKLFWAPYVVRHTYVTRTRITSPHNHVLSLVCLLLEVNS